MMRRKETMLEQTGQQIGKDDQGSVLIGSVCCHAWLFRKCGSCVSSEDAFVSCSHSVDSCAGTFIIMSKM